MNHEHELLGSPTTNPFQSFLFRYHHQIDLIIIVLAMIYFVCRYRKQMFAVFSGRSEN